MDVCLFRTEKSRVLCDEDRKKNQDDRPFFFLLHTRNISLSFYLIFSFFFLNLAGHIFVSEDEARSAIIYIFSIKKISTK